MAWFTDRDRSNFNYLFLFLPPPSKLEYLRNKSSNLHSVFVMITGFNDNGNIMLVVDLVVVFVVNFAMNKMVSRVMNK